MTPAPSASIGIGAPRRLAFLAAVAAASTAGGGPALLLLFGPRRSRPDVSVVEAFSVPVRFPSAATSGSSALSPELFRSASIFSTTGGGARHNVQRRRRRRWRQSERRSSISQLSRGEGRLVLSRIRAATRDVDDGIGNGLVDALADVDAAGKVEVVVNVGEGDGGGGDDVEDISAFVEELTENAGQLTVVAEEVTNAASLGTSPAPVTQLEGNAAAGGNSQAMSDDAVVPETAAQLGSPAADGETAEATTMIRAAAGDAEEEGPTDDTIDAPSVRQILRFAVPAIGVWLCSPILSMIDTSAVGLLSGTAQQAALNPAVSVTDYGGLLVAFMYTATTNLVAAASTSPSDRSDPSKPLTAWTVKSALGLALLVGVGFGLVLSLFARILLRTLIGNDALDPFIFAAALRYVRIRSLGMPAAVVIGTAQSACLGMRDLKSPLYVLLAAAVINFLGDAVFVRNASPWIGGAAGAAWATVFSQYAALWMFLRWFKTEPGRTRSRIARRVRLGRRLPNFSSPYASPPTGGSESSAAEKSGGGGRRRRKVPPPSRGFLSGRFSVLDLFRLPDVEAVREFLPYVGPVTATAVGRISGYLAMSHVASSALGTVDMAAQQIIFSFFCCLTPVCDSLNLTAQSFVPPLFSRNEKKKGGGRARADALRRTLRSFLGAGGVMGAALVGLVATIPFLGRFFTTDLTVMNQVNTAIPGLALFFALSGVVCVGEGMLLGQRDLKFLGNAYGAYFFAVPAVLLRLKRRALAGLQDVGVGTMWKTFSCYQVVRCAVWIVRMMQLQRRTDAESSADGDAAPRDKLTTEPLGL